MYCEKVLHNVTCMINGADKISHIMADKTETMKKKKTYAVYLLEIHNYISTFKLKYYF